MTNATLVCVLSYIWFGLYFLFGDGYLGNGDTNQHEILRDGTCWSRACFFSSFRGGISKRICRKLTHSVTCQLELKISSTSAF